MAGYGKDGCRFCGKLCSGYCSDRVYTCLLCGVSWYRAGGICNLRHRVVGNPFDWYEPPMGCLVVMCEG